MNVIVPVPAGPPVLMGPNDDVDEVELAKGGVVTGEVPLGPVLNASNELTLVPLETEPVAPVEIGPTELVEFGLKVDGPPEELEEAKEKV